MDRLFLFLAVIGAFAILCQWYVVMALRRYLFQRYEKVGRKTAYPLLIAIAVLNIVAVRVAMNPEALPVDTLASKVAAVAFFSYLGWMLALGVMFLFIGLVYRGVRLKDVLLSLMTTAKCQSAPASVGERGCFRPGSTRRGPEPDRANPTIALDSVSETTKSVDQKQIPRVGPGVDFEDPSPGRRRFLKWTSAAGLTLVSGYAGRGIAEAYQEPVITSFDLFHSKLDGAERQLSFAHITDFHYGMFLGTRELEKLVSMLNEIEADAVFMTGDMFHSPLSPIERATPVLRKLRARSLGNFAVMGNHDFYAGEWRSIQSLKDSGWILLRNEWITMTNGTARIHVGGIDDPMVNWVWGTRFPNYPIFMEKAPKTPGFRILLSHRPNILPLAAESGIDLVLAGHVHGGQIIFAVPGSERGVSIASVASQYTHGWYRKKKTSMYLSRGTGLTFVPWRINCPPEITVFRVNSSQDEVLRVTKAGNRHDGWHRARV